jgi:hypothetical protein
MNFIFVKRVALLFLGIFCMELSQTRLHAKPDALLSENEKNYINSLAKDIENIFEFFQDHISTFIDPKDKTPYRDYVKALDQQVNNFEQRVMSKLTTKLVEAHANGTTTFYHGLMIVQEILDEFLTKVHKMHAVLIKYIDVRNDAKKAITLGKELEPYIKDLIDPKTICKLEAKIDRLCKLVEPASDTYLSQQLGLIKKAVDGLAMGPTTKSISGAAILNCITTKLRHNTAG